VGLCACSVRRGALLEGRPGLRDALDPSQLGGDNWWVWSIFYAAISVAVVVRYIHKE
jgi:hypothetical protein